MILIFELCYVRFLAHAKVESVKSKEEAEHRMSKKGSWFPFRWFVNLHLIPSYMFSYLFSITGISFFGGTLLFFKSHRRTPENASGEETSEVQPIEERLTKEEWRAINNLLSYQPDEDLTLHSGKDIEHMTHYLIDVSVGHAAARIISINQTEIICGRFEQLNVSTKLKHRSTHCDVTLKFYGLSAPEGSLAQVYLLCHHVSIFVCYKKLLHFDSKFFNMFKMGFKIFLLHKSLSLDSPIL